MGQPPMPGQNTYMPAGHSSSGQMMNNPTHVNMAPSQQGPQYPVNQPPAMHSANPMKLNAQSQPVHVDPQNPHVMIPTSGVHMEPSLIGSSSNRVEQNPHIMGAPPSGPQPQMMQHPGIMRTMIPPSSSPLSSPSSSSEHSLIQHGPQPVPSAPSATSTPQPEEKEDVAELISFDD